jgi:transcriptional adapter 2-alpha
VAFVEGEHATETELKLKIIEIYNRKLDERERRKAFVIERGLRDYQRLLAVERRRPREEREVGAAAAGPEGGGGGGVCNGLWGGGPVA